MATAWPALAIAPRPPLAEIRIRAQSGDPEAQNDLGSRLLAEKNPAKLAEAREWLRRSADGGSIEGMNNYASMVLLGLGGPTDKIRGKQLRELAATRGSLGAQLTIADRYVHGSEGYPRDPKRALALVRSAAESSAEGADFAMWQLAMMYLQGVGTPINREEAYRWVVRSSDAGGVSGMISRAVMLATGEGVTENDQEARLWYKRASEAGDVQSGHALRGLGAMLVTGEGGAADVPRGIAFLRIAAATDDKHASILLDRFRELITPEVDREANKLAALWMAQHMQGED